jgi:CTP synthase
VIRERHRHRWEFNNIYEERFQQAGMRVSGRYEEKNLAEIMEIEGHPFMIGTQFHPELTSRPDAPHPLFVGLVDAANQYKK